MKHSLQLYKYMRKSLKNVNQRQTMRPQEPEASVVLAVRVVAVWWQVQV
jgi:hypothetical protein